MWLWSWATSARRTFSVPCFDCEASLLPEPACPDGSAAAGAAGAAPASVPFFDCEASAGPNGSGAKGTAGAAGAAGSCGYGHVTMVL